MNTIPLGKKTEYITTYTPDLLYPIPRKKRAFPCYGYDIWNAYDLSWLNTTGKPEVGIGEFIFPAASENLIESKSLKLYLNSFNNSKFSSIDEVIKIITTDLSTSVKSDVLVKINDVNNYSERLHNFTGTCLDNIVISCNDYQINQDYLFVEDTEIEESLYSHLLKSNCPVTGQPDFASIQINYIGKKINHKGLLKYIISFRDHNEFHEQCIERIFSDIMHNCKPKKLAILGRYTRRGGLDINPFRSTEPKFQATNKRLLRQ